MSINRTKVKGKNVCTLANGKNGNGNKNVSMCKTRVNGKNSNGYMVVAVAAPNMNKTKTNGNGNRKYFNGRRMALILTPKNNGNKSKASSKNMNGIREY